VREGTTDEDRQYVEVGTSSTMTSRGATATLGRLRWGINSSTGGADLLVDFRRVQGNLSGTYAGQPLQLENSQDNPGQLFGRSASNTGMYVDQGVKVAAYGGEMYRGQTWNITPDADYPAQNALITVEPSPQRPFRSAGARVAGADAATSALVEPQTLAYQLNASAEDNAYGDLDGFYLDSNAREGLIEERTGGSWSTVIDFDNRFAVTFARKGNVIVPDLRTQLSGGPTPTSSGPYLAPDDLAGAVFEFGSGETKTIPIVGNSEGIWIEGRAPDPVSQLVPRLELDGDYLDGTEPTLGTGWFWWPRVLFLYRRSTWGEREGIRLVLHDASPGVSPPDEFLEVRVFAPGELVLWGWQSSFGRALESEANVDVYQIGDGRQYTRRRGPVGQLVEHVFGDAAPTREFQGQTAAADYVVARDGQRPHAFRRSSTMQLVGMLRRLQGPNIPVVYCPLVERVASGVTTSTLAAQRARGAFPARLEGPIRVETVRGTEQHSELQQVGRITLRGQV